MLMCLQQNRKSSADEGATSLLILAQVDWLSATWGIDSMGKPGETTKRTVAAKKERAPTDDDADVLDEVHSGL